MPPLVRGGGFLSGQKAGGVVKHFRFLTWHPAGGGTFLFGKKVPKEPTRGGASNVVYPPWAEIETYYPDPKAPSPETAPAAARQLKAQWSVFIVGEAISLPPTPDHNRR